ncbi:hypothetical protein VOLCADRAFT_92820 [Volvox carteri f. nagariensis]|uniref:Glycosyltransferase 61 catalytic domain-containing protein n=1 Tax=Volvox carteri f. nagariensis TaxID=3068 RepID=D8U0J6_VOLCA|nr:uncharacterized protein VOLCADRAFT_92820 [Volvox carteri f. nagariensis]EFJ46647.1 hypothetical protein VOLCADRAFT_92820 [Volvox carteri f. nagariensis]|eukprot:XP_002952176.1 hypothetical protein VOLCADRAFT_92820 [Volvox carteri f. nagariensis]
MEFCLALVLSAATVLLLVAAEEPFASNTLSESVNISRISPRSFPSDVWRPLLLTTCFPSLHHESAPCRRVPNLVYGEELLYQDFRIRLPHFVNAEQKRIYLKVLHHYRHIWLRGRVIGDYAYFLNQRGQNLIYSNVMYVGKPVPGMWAEDACMSYSADKHVSAFPPWKGSDTAPAAIFVASPDDYSFQHFTDRVAMMLAQTRHLSTRVAGGWKYIVTGPYRVPAVSQLWPMLVPGFTPESLIHARGKPEIQTRLLVYPCQTPLIHPYTHQLASEVIQQAAGYDPRVIEPVGSRPVILFFARRGSRAWHNENECRLAIEQLIAGRNRNEQLVTFQADAYPNARDVVKLGRRVKLMVGVHGGAFYNLVYMQPGTGIVEVCPVAPDGKSSRCGAMFWEMSNVRNMPYWSVVATNVTHDWQILTMDCNLVVSAVRNALENIENIPSPLEAFHQGTKFG